MHDLGRKAGRLMRFGFCILSFFLSFSVHAQRNLVANGGFEEENICSEFIQNCAPEAWLASSLRSNYYVDAPYWAKSGSHVVGLVAEGARSPAQRSFLRGNLLCALRQGNRYQVTVWIRSAHADILDSIGFCFSESDPLLKKEGPASMVPDHLSMDSSISRFFPQRWNEIRFSFTAKGNERFFLIGSFQKGTYSFSKPPDFPDGYYFFVDEVSILPTNPNETICPGWELEKERIYAEDERHQLLEKKVYAGRRNPPELPPLNLTRSFSVKTAALPSETMAPVPDSFLVTDLLFETDRYTLLESGLRQMDAWKEKLWEFPVDSIVIEGHTDSIGSRAYNDTLSFRRALSVKEYLFSHAPDTSINTIIRVWADTRPAASNDSPEGRSLNRRVVVYIYRKTD